MNDPNHKFLKSSNLQGTIGIIKTAFFFSVHNKILINHVNRSEESETLLFRVHSLLPFQLECANNFITDWNNESEKMLIINLFLQINFTVTFHRFNFRRWKNPHRYHDKRNHQHSMEIPSNEDELTGFN